jgi:SNF2 family DNA or RNA helicase
MMPAAMSVEAGEQAWDALDEWLEDLPPAVHAQAARLAGDKAGRHVTELGPGEWAALVGGGPGARACEVGAAWSPQQLWQFTCTCGRAADPCVHAAATALLVSEKQRTAARERLLGAPAPPAPAAPPRLTVVARTRLEIVEDGLDWFELRAVRDVSETTLTPLELKALLDAEGSWVDLGRKGFRQLVDETDPATLTRLAEAGLRPHGLVSEKRRFHTLQLAGDRLHELLPAATRERLDHRAAVLAAHTPPGLPRALRAELRPYQLEGFRFLTALAQAGCGALLADDMGLGKTVQTLAWLAWLREQGDPAAPAAARLDLDAAPPSARDPQSALVVCPKSLTDNWRAEARKFLPGLHVRVWKAKDLRFFHHEAPWAGLNILSYPQLRLVADKLDRVRFLAAILDEAQAIKNPDSATARAARALQSTHRLALTGTPIENRLLDLWSICAFAVPGVLGSRVRFEREVESLDELDGARDLATRVRPFVLRRTKSQVARDLPERIEEDLYCEMGEAQERLYKAELKKAQQQLLVVAEERQFQQDRFHVLASLMRLRQLCCDPSLLFPGAAVPSAKLEALDDLIEPILAEGHKVLIFSQFTSMLATLRTRLAPHRVPLFSLTGATERRGEVVDQFNHTQGPAVFLISLKAGGSGLNLTSASYVILFDPWWNPAAEAQAIDRAHRIGQTRTVIAYRLLIKDSLEEKIRALQASKAALADGVLGEEALTQTLNLDQLRSLLAG